MTIYYNRFNKINNWFELLPIAGRRLQSAEIAEIQSMSIYRDKRLGNVLFGTGHIIDGCQISVNATATEANITAGSVYYEGMIYDLSGDSVAITGSGQEVVGLKVIYEIVSHEDDPTLKDPAIGYANYGMPGMDRRVANLSWVLNDPAAFPVFKLLDGVVMMAAVPPELEGITPILARRTYDTSGNFLVSGMDGYIEPLDINKVNLVIEAGKAYVLGREIDKLIPTRIEVAKAMSVRRVTNETKTYHTGTSEYALNSTPVKQLVALTATVQVTDNTVTRGNIAGTVDLLDLTPVVDIVSVSQGGTTYNRNTDWILTGNGVDWSPGGAEPAGGSTYTVVYQYTKVMVVDIDYDLNESKVRFLAGDTPVDGTTFQVTYDFYLARRDLYYLEDDGDFQVAQGQPEVFPTIPPSPPNVLLLGEIYLPPNSDDAVVTNYRPKRLTMLELRDMLDRLERSEYNAAIEDLDRAAQISEPSVAKLGLKTDNFTNFERSDITHPLWDAMIDPADNTLILPINYEEHELEHDAVNTTAVLKERLALLPYTEEVVLQQEYGTEFMNVNPYAVWGNTGVVSLNPSEDVWIEVTETFRTINAWWLSFWWNNRTETRMLLDELVPFIRQREVTIKGESFLPEADNIQATFDGIAVALTPVAPTEAGTNPDTVKADADGKFTATFEIPANIRSGTREVRAFNNV